jgi:hypothetical protein
MIAEGMKEVERLVLAGQIPQLQEIEGRQYFTYEGDLKALPDPQDATITVGTLFGLADLANSENIKPGRMLHVVNPCLVSLCAEVCDKWGRRQVDVLCQLPSFGEFSFGEWMDQERFIVGLQSFFDQDMPDMPWLYQLAGNLASEQVQNATDDGVTQRATARTGMVLASNVVVKPRVDLKPWRTFREIEQPTSTFLLRLRSNKDNPPVLSLHIADGEVWQNEAVREIAFWLKAHTAGVKVVA